MEGSEPPDRQEPGRDTPEQIWEAPATGSHRVPQGAAPADAHPKTGSQEVPAFPGDRDEEEAGPWYSNTAAVLKVQGVIIFVLAALVGFQLVNDRTESKPAEPESPITKDRLSGELKAAMEAKNGNGLNARFVTESTSMNDSTPKELGVYCPEGMFPISGGFAVTGTEANVLASRRQNRQWVVTADGNGQWALEVTAACVYGEAQDVERSGVETEPADKTDRTQNRPARDVQTRPKRARDDGKPSKRVEPAQPMPMPMPVDPVTRGPSADRKREPAPWRPSRNGESSSWRQGNKQDSSRGDRRSPGRPGERTGVPRRPVNPDQPTSNRQRKKPHGGTGPAADPDANDKQAGQVEPASPPVAEDPASD